MVDNGGPGSGEEGEKAPTPTGAPPRGARAGAPTSDPGGGPPGDGTGTKAGT